MKAKIRILTYLLLGIIGMNTNPVIAQEDHSKEYKETYTANQNTRLSIENKYGNIDIKDWDKSSLEVKVTILLKDVSEQRAEKLIDNIDIEFSKDGDNIYVETVFNDDFFKQVNRSNHGNNKFEVNYMVMIPATVKIDVKNKYGDIFINKLASASNIVLKYGNIKINQLIAENKQNMAELDLAYSKGTIESCQWLRLNMKYSKLNIQKSKALLVISKYSKLYLDEGSSLICDSKYDSYEIGKVVNFVAETEYSNYRFDLIKNKIALETKYTDVKIGTVPAGFESINIENSYGSIRIGIAADASYRLDGFAKYTKISYPETADLSRFQENNEQRLEGFVGKEGAKSGKVKIETRYGGVKLY